MRLEKTKEHGRLGALLLTGGCALLAVALLRGAQVAGEGVREGLRLCADVVIPSLFPFMVLAGFLATSRASVVLNQVLLPLTKLLRLPTQAASPLLMGLIGGYPVGARTLSVMVSQRRISQRDASRLLCFCVNAGPPFLLCAVGVGMFGSLQLGALLLAAQVGSSLLIGLAMGLFARRQGEDSGGAREGFRPYSVCFVQSVTDGCSGMINICAFVVLFSAITALLSASGAVETAGQLLTQWFPALDAGFLESAFFGVLEVTTGCRALAAHGHAGLLAAAALLSFSGLSVIFQVLAAVHGSGIDTRPFLISRPVHAAVTLGLFCLLLRLFPQALTVWSGLSHPAQVTAGPLGGSASLLLMCAVFLIGFQGPAQHIKKS
ncbi:hypothetical protein H8711_01325 [Clostridiaceae bacterium NSJ-31]|uniref:Sporulation integral membrane protein YlbJ n=1 Tax=Ligaoa zhengdingensis TaxID=2763658 RepID=A0A926DY47_9FIRM|nr:hypothetical protein [Ligaoa zhengdingensis]MBC8545579.1 hypothetical protein [Ligaoa zhengdingensis]